MTSTPFFAITTARQKTPSRQPCSACRRRKTCSPLRAKYRIPSTHPACRRQPSKTAHGRRASALLMETQRMEYVRLGQSGLKVSRLCLRTMNMGTPQWKPWIFDEQKSEPIVRHALEAGVNFIDLADFYSAGVGEEVVGRILGRLARREEIVVTTKVGYDMGAYQNAGGHSRKHVLDGIDASSRRLGMDYLDAYILHYFHTPHPRP